MDRNLKHYKKGDFIIYMKGYVEVIDIDQLLKIPAHFAAL